MRRFHPPVRGRIAADQPPARYRRGSALNSIPIEHVAAIRRQTDDLIDRYAGPLISQLRRLTQLAFPRMVAG
jgi:hypothetical protein